MKILDFDIETSTIYGYPVKDLVLLAMAARQQGITPYELKDFRLDCELAYSIVKADFDKQVEEAIGKQMAALHQKFSS